MYFRTNAVKDISMSEAPASLIDAVDQRAFLSLVKLIGSGQALAMVGAGLSAQLGYPTWGDLLNVLHQRAGGAIDKLDPGRRGRAEAILSSLPSRNGPPSTVGQKPPAASLLDSRDSPQEYKDALGEDFTFVLREVFRRDHTPDATVRSVVRMPFRHVLTTNYDHALIRAHQLEHGGEAAPLDWSNRKEALGFMFGLSSLHDDTRKYVHLHGHVDVPDSLLLTDLQYTERYVRNDESSKRLFAVFAMQRVVFFGFSMDDPDLSAILRSVNATTGHEEPRHYAIMSIDPAREDRHVYRRRFLQKFGVLPVFFEKTPDAGYEGLATIVRELAIAVDAMRSEQGVMTKPLTVEAPTDDDAPIERGPVDHEDPHKNQFGGRATRRGRQVLAQVETLKQQWYGVRLEVCALPGHDRIPSGAKVRFYLHDSFATPVRTRTVGESGTAVLEIECYGAFTVGVRIEHDVGDRETLLELDLAGLEYAPARFRTS
jgi:hypothetical protein